MESYIGSKLPQVRALILAAGLGTRLRPFTKNFAKPAFPVIGVPTFWFSSWHVAREFECNNHIAINLSHAPKSIIEAVNDKDLKKFTGISFHLSDEKTSLLGSSGALWKLKSWVGNETLAVTNGDSICFPNFKEMLAHHRQKKALMTLHLRPFKSKHESFTDVKVSSNSWITSLGKKQNHGTMFSGTYLLEPELIARLPAGVSELKTSLLEPLIKEEKLCGFVEDINWLDIGSIQALARANFELLSFFPQVKPLVELKMQELESKVWVPRTWKKDQIKSLKLKSPCILLGLSHEWASLHQQYGPNFLGLSPPNAIYKIPSSNAVVFEEHVQHLR